MASRFEGRLKRLEEMRLEEVDALLDGLSFDQRNAVLNHLLTQVEMSLGNVSSYEEAVTTRLRSSPLTRARHDAALESIPLELQDRILDAYIAKVETQAD
ncbi:MAG: hypothetical protein JO051_00870 [Acidobacteriaceae bacterium]|nr:hypothetical protein [Acidobacteriaceae bacterium]